MLNTELALDLMKVRLNRLRSDTSLDQYFRARIDAVVEELAKTGIHLTENWDDLMLVVDMAVYQYQNRDSNTGMPEWLRLRRRERWLKEGAKS